ncbi:PREDICTED: protein RIC-3 isoform X5 [Mandrillus leucophaeus]|uniref:RIC3 acetylcholine receptor chaperone n=1 Tax=Mandrillus leucophaeus TaxID=9568 RepID=A0A2K6A1C5_MANLE|nr:PREDICTED: protein RIC-3 isoform X5 [Mandrillus leucophaeus]
MAYSTVQRVALASGLVLALSLLLPKAFLSRGKRQEPPPTPEGYPEETYPIYDLSECIKRRQETILVDYPDPKELSAEETAERMGVIEEEESDHLGWESLPTDPRAQEDNSVTSCDPKPETCSCCFHEDEDPAVLAENAGFNADSYLEQEETTKEEWSQDFRDEGLGINIDKACTGSMLRKRNPQGLE